MKTLTEIKRLLDPLPDDFKRNWCEAKGGCACAGCACAGCANHCGITYEEWQAWMKYDSQWWKKREYIRRETVDGQGNRLTLSKRDTGQNLELALVRWRGYLPELVLMIDASDRAAMLLYDFYERVMNG